MIRLERSLQAPFLFNNYNYSMSKESLKEDNKLYINVTCGICLGSNYNRNGRHCPYCDEQARHYIEASLTNIDFCLQFRDTSDKIYLINSLQSSVSGVLKND